MKLKHALTKEGAIMAITRKQVSKLAEGQAPKGILKSFIDLYMEQPNDRIMETYQQEFGKELVIVEYK
tara:strand:+ start:970 stop:1173 length:204 start_codon:yes stop_codon:yes gene_type:complete